LTLGVIMTPNVIRRIITDNASCVMLKHEDCPDWKRFRLPGDSSRRASCAAFRF
jgi:hypothetical protein